MAPGTDSPTPPLEPGNKKPGLPTLPYRLESTENEVAPGHGAPPSSCTPDLLDSAADAALPPPRRLGRYELLEEIGHGGMGRVFTAIDPKLERLVAVKTIRSGLLAEGHEIDRFRTEARAVAQLSHANIVPIYDVGEDDGQHYFTMEFISGGTLSAKIEHFANADPREAVRLLAKVARAVQHAHENQILHRDLKPANILLDAAGEPRVGDFGMAKILTYGGEHTAPNQIVGTVPYMAPEQLSARKDQIGPHTDVWSLGVVLYELLSGCRPFPGKSIEEVTPTVLHDDPPALSHQGLPGDKDLEAVVFRCLEKSPALRFHTAQELADDLERWLRGEPTLTRPLSVGQKLWRRARRRPVAAGFLVCLFAVLVAGLGFYLAWDPERWEKGIRAKLRQSRTAVLVGETGPPAGLRWVAGKDKSNLSTDRGQPFSVSTTELAMLELLNDPGVDHFRFQAEIRHFAGQDHFPVGVMFFHQIVPREGQALHTYTTLGYSDHFDALADYWRAEKLLGMPVPPPPPLGNPVEMHSHILRADFTRGFLANGPIEFFRPAVPGPAPWRKLSVESDGKAVVCAFDGKPLESIEISELLVRARRSNQANPLLSAAEVENAFSGKLGLGLFVHKGEAQFKNIIVEPIHP